jgi:(E)-4-hydroxy-3-methylbut-2-enyl-diphosphate synthase
MGCVVNGPGESRDADIGLAAGKGRGAIFRKGEVVRTVSEDQFLSALMEEGRRVILERYGEDVGVEDEGSRREGQRGDEVIALTVVESSQPNGRSSGQTLPGRAARRGG